MDMVILTALGVGGATVVGAAIGFIFKKTSHPAEEEEHHNHEGHSHETNTHIFVRSSYIFSYISSNLKRVSSLVLKTSQISGICSKRASQSSPSSDESASPRRCKDVWLFSVSCFCNIVSCTNISFAVNLFSSIVPPFSVFQVFRQVFPADNIYFA